MEQNPGFKSPALVQALAHFPGSPGQYNNVTLNVASLSLLAITNGEMLHSDEEEEDEGESYCDHAMVSYNSDSEIDHARKKKFVPPLSMITRSKSHGKSPLQNQVLDEW
ncbi:hypothetical protein FRX31_003310 [Thalictrum thalictroides]|uniref:Uncharacterized protein n=1 Tax=Thalictrum thalictroides TaxID=46969 RepID=A0A7J6XF98_THATH|nr:hypothetical protein FRX31_003310 [Thalictrum thalictroides]